MGTLEDLSIMWTLGRFWLTQPKDPHPGTVDTRDFKRSGLLVGPNFGVGTQFTRKTLYTIKRLSILSQCYDVLRFPVSLFPLFEDQDFQLFDSKRENLLLFPFKICGVLKRFLTRWISKRQGTNHSDWRVQSGDTSVSFQNGTIIDCGWNFRIKILSNVMSQRVNRFQDRRSLLP